MAAKGFDVIKMVAPPKKHITKATPFYPPPAP